MLTPTPTRSISTNIFIFQYFCRCGSKQRCSIPVSRDLFDDPCPETHKYVEVHFTCQPLMKRSTTSHAIPPWLLDLSATPAPRKVPSTTTVTTTTTTATTTTPSTTTTPITVTIKSTTVAETHRDSAIDDINERINDVAGDSDADLLVLETLINHCPPVTTRNLFWNWTTASELAIQPCPGGSSGFAKWRCGGDATWVTVSPDLAECQSHWLARLEARLRKTGDVTGVATELTDQLAIKTLYGGDLSVVTQVLQSLAHKARQRMFTMASHEEKEDLATSLVEATLKIGSNLLEDSQMMAWSDLEPVERAQLGSSLVLAIQENTFFLADSVNIEKNVIMMEENLLTSVRIMRAKELHDQEFFSRNGHVELKIPNQSLIENSENGAVRLVFFHYNNLDHVLPSSTNGIKFLNSHIASASLSKGHATLLSSPLTATFQHLEGEGMANPSCVWWDYVTRTWSEEGCWVLETNASQTSCQCDHLGNFALLMEESSMVAAPHSVEVNSPSTSTVVIATVVSIVICVVTIAATFVIIRRFSKGVCKNKLPCLEAKESSPGYYPYLSSSNTSTTITATTPDKNTAPGHGGSQYFLNNECQVLRPLMITPIGPNSTIYRATFANGQQAHVIPIEPNSANDGNKYQFRPITPSASHIYMEIDPVYNSETMSDILVSDTSDDDLKRSSDDTHPAQARANNNVTSRLLHHQQPSAHGTLNINSVLNARSLQRSDSADFDSGRGSFQPNTLAGVHTRQQQPQAWAWANTGVRLGQQHQQPGSLHSNNIHAVFQ